MRSLRSQEPEAFIGFKRHKNQRGLSQEPEAFIGFKRHKTQRGLFSIKTLLILNNTTLLRKHQKHTIMFFNIFFNII